MTLHASIVDNFGDRARVESENLGGGFGPRVYLSICPRTGREQDLVTDLALTPKKARRLARALKRAARAAKESN